MGWRRNGGSSASSGENYGRGDRGESWGPRPRETSSRGSGTHLAVGVRKGDVPDWSCNCGCADNWGARLRCRQCGRSAPERTAHLQRQAADRRRRSTGKDKSDRSRAGQRPGDTTQGDELAQLRARLAKQDAELAKLRAAAGEDAAEDSPRTGRAAEDELLQEVRRWEADLGRLEQCSHPGVEHQIEDLRRRIAFRRDEIRGTWTPERLRRRLELRAAEAQKDVDRADAAVAEAQRVLDEAQAAFAQAAARAEAKRRTAEDRRDELARHKSTVDTVMVDGGDKEERPTTDDTDDPEKLLRLLMATPQGVALLAARAAVALDSPAGRCRDVRERSPRRAIGAEARGGQ